MERNIIYCSSHCICTKKRPCEETGFSCLQHISIGEKKNNQATYDSLILKLWPSEQRKYALTTWTICITFVREISSANTHAYTEAHTHIQRGKGVKEGGREGGRGEEWRIGGREEGMEEDRKREFMLCIMT